MKEVHLVTACYGHDDIRLVVVYDNAEDAWKFIRRAIDNCKGVYFRITTVPLGRDAFKAASTGMEDGVLQFRDLLDLF